MAVDKQTIRQEVITLIGNSARISNANLDILLEADNRSILGITDWSNREGNTVITTNVQIDVTGATVTESSTTVTSTDAANSWIGRFARVGTEDDIYEVSSVNASTNATLSSIYVGDTDSSANLTIIQLYYNLPSDCIYVTDIVSATNGYLDERSPEYLDDLDPGRKTNASIPSEWSMAGTNSSNSNLPMIELHPWATTNTPLRVTYVKDGLIPNDTDIVLYPSDLLKWKTAASACRYMAATSNDNSRLWMELAASYDSQYAISLRDAVKAELPNMRKRRNIRARKRDRDVNRDRWARGRV